MATSRCRHCGGGLTIGGDDDSWVHEDEHTECDTPEFDRAHYERDLRDFMVRKGYSLADVIKTIIAEHRYDYRNKGDRPDDPGYHGCTCGEWHGYWSEFDKHQGAAVATEMIRLAPALAKGGAVKDAAVRLTAHADWMRDGPDTEPPYTMGMAEYDTDLRLVLAALTLPQETS